LEIQKLVLDKATWILKKQKEYKETIPEVTRPSFKENTTLPYLGVYHPLKITNEILHKIYIIKVSFALIVESSNI
jgi:Protein of unknown function DUF45